MYSLKTHCTGIAWVVFISLGLITGEAIADTTLFRDESVKAVSVTIGKKATEGWVVIGSTPLSLTAQGPGSLSIEVMRQLPEKKPRQAGNAKVTVKIDDAVAATGSAKPKAGKARVGRKGKLGVSSKLTVAIPAGEHTLVIAVGKEDKLGVIVTLSAKVEVKPAAAIAAIAAAEAAPNPPLAPLVPPSEPPVPSSEKTAESEFPVMAAESTQPGANDALEEIRAAEIETTTENAGGDTTASAIVPEAPNAKDSEPAFGLMGGLRLGAYHSGTSSDLGAALAVGGEVRVGLPLLPPAFGRFLVAVSGSWQQFSHSKSMVDEELGDFRTEHTLDFVPLTLEAIYELPHVGPLVLYGGVGFALYITMEGFGAKDERSAMTPGMQAFGAAGVNVGPVLLAVELRYTNVEIDFDTGTTGSGAGLFGQAIATFIFF